MASLSARTVPVALALALMSAASVAEDRPNTTLVQKSKSSAVTPSATQKSRAQAPAQVNGSTATVKAGSKQGAPAADSRDADGRAILRRLPREGREKPDAAGHPAPHDRAGPPPAP